MSARQAPRRRLDPYGVATVAIWVVSAALSCWLLWALGRLIVQVLR